MSKENLEPIKISKKGKVFLTQMKINRIKLDLEPLTYPQCIEKMARFFKVNNDLYLKMLKEEESNAN